VKLIGYLVAAISLGAWAMGSAPQPLREAAAPAPTSTAGPVSKPADNLSYWLSQAKAAESRPAAEANASGGGAGKYPFGTDENFRRQDALPGVIELSDGQVLPGYLFTTAEKDWLVWVETEKRWRRVPFLALLSITAVVVEEQMEPVWRWKEMGVPERVYTGEEYPTRRLDWRFHLIDDSTITGSVKGQPVWVEAGGRKSGPFVLHETVKGPIGQKLSDLVTVRRIIVSRRLMDEVQARSKVPGPAGAPAPRP
jgi:hypothetical protein